MPLIIAFCGIFIFSFLLNALYIGLFKGREEDVFGSMVGVFYFLHGLSLAPALVLSIILLSLFVSILVLLEELILLTIF
ncbi:MAG: hypothetical protein ACE5IC_04100 [Candidatus Brocadiales bacterium]